MTFRKFSSAFNTCLLLSLLCGFSLTSAQAAAASRDHLTEQEVERVKDAQALDKRTEVFIKAAERRLLLITNPNAASLKQSAKDLELWGEMPKGTRAELLSDLAKILDEAITNIDDTSARDPKSPLLNKSVRKLAEASTRFLAQLAPLRDQVTESAEREALEQAIENAQSVIEAAGKLPPPAAPAKKK